MILPKFIAVRAYLESKGIAFANEEYIEKLFDVLKKEKEITAKQGMEILGHKTDTSTTIFRLFEHVGIIKKRNDRKENKSYYSFSKIGKQVLTDNPMDNPIQPFTPFFLTWLPLKIFLKYLQLYPGSDIEVIRENLGGQVAKHTREAKEILELRHVDKDKGVDKPFNRHIIPNVLVPLGKSLRVVRADGRNGPYYLTPLGKYVANSINLENFTFYRLNNYFKYFELAILDFLEAKPSTMVIVTEEQQVDSLENFVEKEIMQLNFEIEPEILVKENNFEAVLTKNRSYLSRAKDLMSLSYDPLNVLEINAQIVNIIE
ncbi:MAG: hypothetical protein ACTSUC_00025 [Promethearchaeota archaeon]